MASSAPVKLDCGSVRNITGTNWMLPGQVRTNPVQNVRECSDFGSKNRGALIGASRAKDVQEGASINAQNTSTFRFWTAHWGVSIDG